jgi:hypothetical protein
MNELPAATRVLNRRVEAATHTTRAMHTVVMFIQPLRRCSCLVYYFQVSTNLSNWDYIPKQPKQTRNLKVRGRDKVVAVLKWGNTFWRRRRARGSVVGWGTMLQAGRSRFSFSTERLQSWSLCNILSDEEMGLSFTIAAGPRQSSHSRVRVPRVSWSYLTSQVLDSPNIEDQFSVFISLRNRVA